MTERFIRDLAERYGLEVLKRINTGSKVKHFATFELSGVPERVRAAWECIKGDSRGPDFDVLAFVNNTEHPDHGKPYIHLECIWCETSEPSNPGMR